VYSGHPYVVLPRPDSASYRDHYLTTTKADYKPFTCDQSAVSSQVRDV